MKGQIWNAITAVATTVIAIFTVWIASQIVELKEEQARTEVWQKGVDAFIGTGPRYSQDQAIQDLKPIVEKVNDHELRIRELERIK